MSSLDAHVLVDAAAGDAILPRRRLRGRARRRLVAIAFVLPALLINLLVIGGPAVASVWYSFTDWNGITPPNFIGLANWIQLAGDSAFWADLVHNAIYLLILLVFPLGIGLLGAWGLFRIRRGASLLRVVFFIPYLLISVVTAQIWRNLLNPATGLAQFLDHIGVHWLDGVYFLGDQTLALPSVAGVDSWTFWGFLVVYFFATMQNVDPTQIEAARIDGASAFEEFRYVVIPALRPALAFSVSFTVIGGLLVFDMPYILTGGGPAGSSEVASILVNRTAFVGRQAGYAAAMALTLTVLSAAVLGVLALLRRGEES